MMSRIEKTFNKLKENNKKALITYVTAGDPSIEKTEQLIYSLEKEGANIIEIGIPFSDPLAGGAVIQKSTQNALNNGINLNKILNCVKSLRCNTKIPIIFFVYYNTVFAYGVKEFVSKCQELEIDGLIIPDLPLEEEEEIMPYIKESNVALIPIVSSTSKGRIKYIVKDKKGFVYCIPSLDDKEMKEDSHNKIEEFLKSVRENTELPIVNDFDIVEKLNSSVDGVIKYVVN